VETILVPKLKSNLQARAKRLADNFLSKGFLYVKIELEANVQPDNYRRNSECFSCSGSGRLPCQNCDGSRIIETRCSTCDGEGTLILIKNEEAQLHPCPDCVDGRRETTCDECSDGYVNCSECDGRGYTENEDWYDDYHDAFWEVFRKKLGKIKDCLKYSRIYNDGSVDTEVTLTLRVNYIKELPAIVSFFAETCRAFGRCNTGNAGLHITLLPGYKYPRTEKLDETKLLTFKKQVNKLLLGLICLGSPNDSTRAFEYRDLEISSNRKYSAIYTHGDTCVEYRLFDACFDKPSYIIRYLELISKTLCYYTDKPRRILKLKKNISLKKSNEILNKGYRGCYRKLVKVFRTDESITRLFVELSYLVKNTSKQWLRQAYYTYIQGLISKTQLFSELVTELKGGV